MSEDFGYPPSLEATYDTLSFIDGLRATLLSDHPPEEGNASASLVDIALAESAKPSFTPTFSYDQIDFEVGRLYHDTAMRDSYTGIYSPRTALLFTDFFLIGIRSFLLDRIPYEGVHLNQSQRIMGEDYLMAPGERDQSYAFASYGHQAAEKIIENRGNLLSFESYLLTLADFFCLVQDFEEALGEQHALFMERQDYEFLSALERIGPSAFRV